MIYIYSGRFPLLTNILNRKEFEGLKGEKEKKLKKGIKKRDKRRKGEIGVNKRQLIILFSCFI